MSDHPTRREFLTRTAVLSAGAAAVWKTSAFQAEPPPADHAGDGLLRAAPLTGVRFGMIGVGDRGSTHVRLINLMRDAEIVAVADPHVPAAERAAKACREAGKAVPTLYTTGDYAYRQLLERDDVDAVIISTPWKWHHPQGVESMNAGKHAYIEVPLAIMIDHLWDLVKTSEATGRHCMMLENVNYGRDELLTLNLCRQKVIGEITHAEASYIHDLRSQMQDLEWGTGSWRTAYHTRFNGNLYPTHGLGPVAQYMNLDRTEDRFETLISMSSPALGRAAYGREKLPDGHAHRGLAFTCGDINTSILKTKLGRTIMVQYDTTTPRPYTRHNLIQGTRGCIAGFPTRVAIEGWGDHHEWIEGTGLEEVRRKYEHPLWARMGREAEAAGGHGGMDYIMLRRIVECLKQGNPMDQTVYEGASWSAVRPLSIASVAEGGSPMAFPDFTRGHFSTIRPLDVVS